MANRWKSRNRSTTINEQQQRLLELEFLLAQRDETIADLEKKLSEQLQTVKKLRRDREELRTKNASLVGKLAEVSRKNSIANVIPPPTRPRVFHRTSTCCLPSLPTTPGSPNLAHNDKPPQSLPPDTHPRPGPSPKDPTAENSITEDSDTDYSDIEEKGDKKMESEDVTQSEIDNEIAAVWKTAEKLEWNRTHDQAKPPCDNGWSSSPPLFPRRKHSNSGGSSSSNVSSTSFGSGESGREGSYQVSGSRPHSQSGMAKNSLKMQKIPSSERLASTLRQMIPKRSSPETPLRKTSQQGGGNTARGNDTVSTAAMKNDSYFAVTLTSNSDLGSGSVSVSSKASTSTSDAQMLSTTKEGNAKGKDIVTLSSGASNGAGATSAKRTGKKKNTTFSDSTDVIPVEKSRASTCRESTSSEYQSSEATPTDLESSMEVFSPTIVSPMTAKTDGMRGTLKSLPNLISEELRPATTRSVTVAENRKSAVDDTAFLVEEEDTLDELGGFGTASNMRSRTQTLSVLTGGKRKVEFGRKKLKQHRLEMKRFSSVSTSAGISQGVEHVARERANTIHELELLSPILQAKIRNMTLKRIYSMYGGKDIVTKAVGVIANAYQTYRLKRRFLERQNEKRENRTLQRKRAESMRQPNRHPSIMFKNGSRYRNKQRQDPILKTTETAERLAKERVPHAHSGARQELMERKRSEASLNAEPLDEGGEDEKREGAIVEEKAKVKKTLVPTLSISQIKVEFGADFEFEDESSSREMQAQNIIFTLTSEHNEERKIDTMAERGVVLQDKPDGLVGSESAQSLSSETRPISIFSTSSMESSLGDYGGGANGGNDRDRLIKFQTLPPPSRMNQQEAKKEADQNFQKLMTGIHYFNKKPVKGIQYLIRNSQLEDDPKGVADFFINQSGLSKVKIGEFLGEINSEFNMAVLESIVERSNMGDKPIDEALREFQQMFRMPGEAQKIDRIMEVFALEYHKYNMSMGMFKSEDSAYILSFAIMMLHTSLHNPSVKTRTSRKQWLSMNRGNNDGENFPDPFLMEIFDRIQATEFATGIDHTQRVVEIEKQIIGLPIQKLSSPHRYLVLKMSANEVLELNVKPGFRNRHRRVFFFFNDIAVICKRKHNNEFIFKDTFSLLNVLPVKFESHHYKHGVQLHAVDSETPYQFNCDSSLDREQLLHSIDTITQHLKQLETERITALGTTLSSNRAADGATDKAGLVCDAGDLISSRSLAASSTSSSSTIKHRDDFVPGVGDLVTTSLPTNLIRTHTENRISRDSGFSSQQLTPTPPQSPSPSETNPAPSSTLVTPTVSPSSSINTLAASTPPRSKSTDFDALKQANINPPSPNRSPSMDFLKRRKSTPAATSINSSPLLDVDGKSKKKERGTSDKTHKKGIFTFNKSKVKDSSDGGKSKVRNLSGSREASASPQAHRKLLQKHDSSLDDSTETKVQSLVT